MLPQEEDEQLKPERVLCAKSHRMARQTDSSGSRLATCPSCWTHCYFPLLLFFSFWDRDSLFNQLPWSLLCRPSCWCRTCNNPASASWALGLEVGATIPRAIFFLRVPPSLWRAGRQTPSLLAATGSQCNCEVILLPPGLAPPCWPRFFFFFFKLCSANFF